MGRVLPVGQLKDVDELDEIDEQVDRVGGVEPLKPTALQRVAVVDDHRAVADAMAFAVDREPGLTSVGVAYTAVSALEMLQLETPHAVLMDVRLGHDDGIALTAELTKRLPDLRVIVLTAHLDQGLLRRAAEAGACALLPKDGSWEDVLAALQTASRDGFHVHPKLLRGLVGSQPARGLPPVDLTSREAEVLGLLAEGRDAAEIARSLGIAVLTSRGHIKSVLAKLGAHSQLEAVVTASRLGMVSLRGTG
ncbi:MAG: response regulator transcription factor [Dermatophilaceae bacterium]|nr:response regulator transcription factor [Dermatophilaceae bacterium]